MKKLPKLAYGDILLVVWHDAYSAHDKWTDFALVTDDAGYYCCITSVGSFIGANKRYLYLVMTVDHGAPDDFTQPVHMSQTMAVPLGCIERIDKLLDVTKCNPNWTKKKPAKRRAKR